MTSRSTRIGAHSVRSRHAVLATLTVGLLALSACSSGSGADSPSTAAGSTGGGGPVTLTLATSLVVYWLLQRSGNVGR